MKSPLAAKQRLQRLLSKTTEVRRKYQSLFADARVFSDRDFTRSLDEHEARLLHNAWMDDVSAWISTECLAQYNQLLTHDSEGKGKGSAAKPADNKGGKRVGKAGRTAAGKAGRLESSAAKPGGKAGPLCLATVSAA